MGRGAQDPARLSCARVALGVLVALGAAMGALACGGDGGASPADAAEGDVATPDVSALSEDASAPDSGGTSDVGAPARDAELAIGNLPACTDLTTKPWVIEASVKVIDAPFVAHGNVATAGGCLASQYLAT